MPDDRSYQRFFAELKRRKVFRVAAVYGAVAFVVLQVADILVPALALPESFMRGIALISILLFPVALVLAWAFELTPEGMRRTDEAEAGELTQIIEQPPARRWPSGLFALVGVLALATAAWLSLRPASDAGVESSRQPATAETADGSVENASSRGVQFAMTSLEDDPRPSIAVMPFTDLSPDGDQEYFGDGMTEEILNALARIRELRVAARTSTFAYKDSNPTIDQIRADLGVEAILEGSVRTDGQRLRVTAQLIETETGFHLWSDTYDRNLDDVFAIQTEIAESIADEMKVSLGLEGQDLVVVTADLTAYDLYLQGRARMRERGAGVAEAIELFEAAVARDSAYAPAWASLAESYTLAPFYQEARPDSADWAEAFASAETAAGKALALDPDNASARVALGSIRRDSRQWAAAAEQYERALQLSPDNVEAQHQYAEYLYALGRIGEGLRVARHALALDPLSTIRISIVAWGQYLNDDCEGAIETGLRGLALEPGKPSLASVVASCRMYLRRYDEAEQLVLEAFSETPDDTTFARSFVGAMRSGDASLVPPELNTSNSFPEVWLVVGDTASAFEAMESVLFNPPFTVPYLVWQPDLDSLHDDPRYLDIMRRLDLEGRQPIRTER